MSPVDGPARRAGRAGRGQCGWRLRAIAFAVVVLLPVAAATFAPPALASTTFTVTATIPVGAAPRGVAVDPGTHTAYVTNTDSGTVSVIDEATNAVTATIPVEGVGWGVAVDPGTHTAYVANAATDTVWVIDEATNTVTATIPVGSNPWGVAVDPGTRTVYVTNFYSGTVSVIDEATNTVTATIPVGTAGEAVNLEGVAVDPGTHTAYVANNGGYGEVWVIDEATNTVTATIPVGEPTGVAVDPGTHTAYVVNYGRVSVINEATNTVTASIPGGWGLVAVDPGTRTAYVTNGGMSNTVSVINEATNTVTASIPVGSLPWGVAVDPGTHTAYVTNASSNTVSVISVGLGSQAITFTSTAPSGAVVGGTGYPVTATGGASGNPVTFSIDASSTSGCALSGTTVSFSGPAGTCVVDANQAGNTSYNPAPQVQQSFSVGLGSQAITFTSTAPSGAVVGGPAYPVTATGGASGNPVTFSIDASSTSGCALSGTTVSFSGPGGTCVVDANQAGNTSYNPAPQVQQSFSVADTDLALHGVPGNSTVDATGPSGAVVSYTPPTASDGQTRPAVTCNHSSGSTFPIGTTTVTCTATDADDTPSTVTASFTVTVRGALAQLTDLLTLVQPLPPGTSLATKTQNAINYYKTGDTADTCSTLSSIISEAKAQSRKKLTSTQAAAVVSAATRIRSVIGC
jgi:YVTN family beta-propeller protein